MADQSDPKPWTVKNIPPEERNAAIAAAKREGMELGPWMARAIRTAIQTDRQADRAPVPLEQPRVRPSDPQVDLGSLERMVALAEKVQAMTGKPPGRSIEAPIKRLLRVGLKAMESPTERGDGSD